MINLCVTMSQMFALNKFKTWWVYAISFSCFIFWPIIEHISEMAPTFCTACFSSYIVQCVILCKSYFSIPKFIEEGWPTKSIFIFALGREKWRTACNTSICPKFEIVPILIYIKFKVLENGYYVYLRLVTSNWSRFRTLRSYWESKIRVI